MRKTVLLSQTKCSKRIHGVVVYIPIDISLSMLVLIHTFITQFYLYFSRRFLATDTDMNKYRCFLGLEFHEYVKTDKKTTKNR
jgi:hypothetical protein